jgi:hypothetical protein
MQSSMSDRIAYGRRIQDEATQLLARFGASADRAAEQWASDVGLTETDEAFRRAVFARVVRLLGKSIQAA